MKKILCFLLLAFISVRAQEWEWAYNTGPRAGGQSDPFIKTDSEGNVITAVVRNDDNNEFVSFTIITKRKSTGEVMWTKSLNVSGENNSVNTLCIDKTGNIYFSGYFRGNLTFADTVLNSVVWDCYLASLDKNGMDRWILDCHEEFGTENIVTDDEGNIILAANDLEGSFWKIYKYKNNGNGIWHKDYRINAWISRAACDSENSIYLPGLSDAGTISLHHTFYGAASRKYNSIVVRLTAQGNLGAVESFPGAGIYDLGLDANDNLYLKGSFKDSVNIRQKMAVVDVSCQDVYNQPCPKLFVAKLLKNDSCFWLKKISDNSYPVCFTASKEGDVYLSGGITDSVSFDGFTVKNDTVSRSCYVVKLNALGHARWLIKNSAGYLASCDAVGVAAGDNSSVYLAGNYLSRPTAVGEMCVFGYDTLRYTNIIFGDHFIAKIKEEGSPVYSFENLNQEQFLNIYPNPCSGFVTLKCSADGMAKVYDVFGNCVLSEKFTPPASSLDLSSCTEGIYFVKTDNGNISQIRKLIVKKSE